MSHFTCWYVATEDQAPQLADMDGLDERDWDFLSMQIREIELMALAEVLSRGHSESTLRVSDKLLYQTEDQGVLVARISDDLIQRLAEVVPDQIAALAEAWVESNPYEELLPNLACKLIGQMIQIAKRAIGLNKPILVVHVL